MFIALLINPILCFYHIIIHSLFKSILFLLAGSLIHIQYNYQNIYQIKMTFKFYWIIYLLTSNILILSLSIILRLELALPGFILCSSLQYNSNITFHGIFMISSMIMPILIGGFGNMLGCDIIWINRWMIRCDVEILGWMDDGMG